MLDYFFCYIIGNNDTVLFKFNSKTLECIDTVCPKTTNFNKLKEIAKEEGSLLLGPYLDKNKNRLRLIKYYENNNQNRVKVYRNLNRGKYSFMQNNLVIGYNTYREVFLENCVPIIRDGGRRKVIQTGVRNVHAFIEGDITVDRFDLDYSYHQVQYSLTKGFIKDGKPVNFKNRILQITYNKIYIST